MRDSSTTFVLFNLTNNCVGNPETLNDLIIFQDLYRLYQHQYKQLLI